MTLATAFPCPHDVADGLERIVARCFNCRDLLPEEHESYTTRSGEVLPVCGSIECDVALWDRVAAEAEGYVGVAHG